ncbi:SDR family NAD(P)-dependent oxidoreductase [Solirubrobacter taibaiensis]|nr:SDR family NAD(P)-dependent oxidoreductase [Solirubrobacter taibaiensis]
MNPSSLPDPDRRLARTPIAIVGLAGLYPKSHDLRAFWRNVVDAADCIEDVPATHWNPDDYYDADPRAEDKTYCKRGGFMPDVAFNPLEFGMPPNTLEVTDVLQLLSLMVARDTLADAGVDAGSFDRSRTGVVLGITGANQLTQPLSARLQTPVIKDVVRSCGLDERTADEIAQRFKRAYIPWEENSFPGMLGNVVAGRIANRLDLGGMNCTVDAACASSLAAIKLAASELIEGRADLMLTGGCDAENTILMYMCFSKTPALSRSGQIRPFDQQADGTLIGEGIGMLALKRLADAERDGDRVYAVLRGIGTSSDGRFKSIYAPRAEGQQLALRRAYADADCGPESVELFEAHGTGTVVGDATELSALRAVCEEAGAAPQTAAIGSVKSQIGHTKAAAGAAGMIKLALALYHRVLPPTINVEQPHESIGGASAPFYVNTQTRPWVRDPEHLVRRAAISSFGFGGTNFHMVLEEGPTSADTDGVLHDAARVHLWHAATPDELLVKLESGAPALGGGALPAGDARVGLVARTEAELDDLRATAIVELRTHRDADAWSHPRGIHYRRSARPGAEKVAALFAGQGSQYLNMGLQAALNVPPVRDAFDAANVHVDASPTLARTVFPVPAFEAGAASSQVQQLCQTRYAQPAIGALSVGQYRFLCDRGFAPDGFLGHSFGELTALWAAGCFDDDAFFRLAAARGRAMAPVGQGEAGAMAALHAPESVARELAAAAGVDVCNVNASDQVVVGGASAEIDHFVATCAARDLQAQRLNVAAAFHTRFVAHAVDAFRTTVEAVPFVAPARPVYANTPGAAYGDDAAANRRVLAEQLRKPVHFAAQVEAMYAAGFRVFVEFGPKNVLGQLVQRTLAGRDAVVISCDGGPARDSDLALKQAAAQLAVLGLGLDDLNVHSLDPQPRPERKGMTIPLNGINHVSEARLAAYRASLAEDFATTTSGTSATSASANPDALLQAHADLTDRCLRAIERLLAVLEAHTPPTPVAAEPAPKVVAAAPKPSPAPAAAPVPAAPAAHFTDMPVLAPVAAVASAPVVDTSAITGAVLAVIAEKTGYPADTLDPSMDIEADLGIDSIKRVEIMAALQADHPELTPDPERLAELRTLNDIIGLLTATDTPAPAAPAPAAHFTDMPVLAPVAAVASAPVVDTSAITGAVLAVIAEKTGYPADTLDPSMDIEADLGIDSIKRVEIMAALQADHPELTPDPERLAELRTLNDIIGLLTATDTPAPAAPAPAAHFTDTPTTPEPSLNIGRTHIGLQVLPAIDELAMPFADQPVAVLVSSNNNNNNGDTNGETLTTALTEALDADGWRVLQLELDDDDAAAAAEARIEAFVAAAGRVDLCAYLATHTPTGWGPACMQLEHALLLAKHVQGPLRVAAQTGKRAAFVTVTRLDAQLATSGVSEPAAVLSGVSGLVKTLAAEAPELFCRAIDIDPQLTDQMAAAAVLSECRDTHTETLEVGVDGLRRVTLALSPTPDVGISAYKTVVPEPGAGDVIVVTGGARGVTAECVKGLAARHSATYLLLGRTPLTAEPDYAAGVSGEAELKAAIVADLRSTNETPAPTRVAERYRGIVAGREIRATLAAIEATGGTARYLEADISDSDAVAAVLAPYAESVTTLIHGAGALADRRIVDKRPGDAQHVFEPKLLGLRNVVTALSADSLRHIVLFSSVAGLFGNPGQADYAMANEALNKLACAWKRVIPDARVTAIDWGAWDGGMVTPQLKQMFEERGVVLLPRATGVAMFVEQFSAERAGDVMTLIGPAAPLSGRERPQVQPGERITLAREIAPLAGEPVIRDHCIGGASVLPATVALGWCVNVLEHLHPGQVVECRDFRVLKGVIFDGAEHQRYELVANPSERGGVAVSIHGIEDAGQVRPHYSGTFVLAPTAPAAPAQRRLPTTALVAPATVYEDGTLFHGPLLQGVKRVLAADESHLTVECRLDDTPMADGEYSGAQYSPVLADVLLQAPLVWARRFRGSGSLPLGFAQMTLHAPLPSGEPFIVLVEDIQEAGPRISCTVTACAPDGRVLQRITGLTVVLLPDLAAKFAHIPGLTPAS